MGKYGILFCTLKHGSKYMQAEPVGSLHEALREAGERTAVCPVGCAYMVVPVPMYEEEIVPGVTLHPSLEAAVNKVRQDAAVIPLRPATGPRLVFSNVSHYEDKHSDAWAGEGEV